MRTAPWILGLALAAIGGAVSGASISTAPIVNRDTAQGGTDGNTYAYTDAGSAASRALPDHYALETPKGRVEVADLALRGRLHDSAMARMWREERSGERYPSYDTYDEYTSDRDTAFFNDEIDRPAPSARTYTAAAAPLPVTEVPVAAPPPIAERKVVTRAEAPLALADPAPVSAAKPAGPSARTINVAAALAAQK